MCGKLPLWAPSNSSPRKSRFLRLCLRITQRFGRFLRMSQKGWPTRCKPGPLVIHNLWNAVRSETHILHFAAKKPSKSLFNCGYLTPGTPKRNEKTRRKIAVAKLCEALRSSAKLCEARLHCSVPMDQERLKTLLLMSPGSCHGGAGGARQRYKKTDGKIHHAMKKSKSTN